MGLPVGTSDRESAYQCRRHKRPRFDVWVGTLEKEMATHSGILAWRIPWTEKPHRLQSMGLQRVGHNWGGTTQGYLSPKISFPSVTVRFLSVTVLTTKNYVSISYQLTPFTHSPSLHFLFPLVTNALLCISMCLFSFGLVSTLFFFLNSTYL